MTLNIKTKEILPITYYYNNNEITDSYNIKNDFYNGVTEYLKEKRDIPFIEKNFFDYKKIHIDEEIKNDTIIKKEIDYFKYKLISDEGKKIIENWYNKYLKIFNGYNCVFNLSAGLDSRVLLSFLINSNKIFYINNYHRDTVYEKVNDNYDIEFIDFVCSKYHNLKKINCKPDDIYLTVGGHFSEWCRDMRVFKSKEFLKYVYLCRKNGTVYPMIDKELLTIDPIIPNLLNTYIINKFAPELLEYKFQSGKNLYTKEKLPINFLKGVKL